MQDTRQDQNTRIRALRMIAETSPTDFPDPIAWGAWLRRVAVEGRKGNAGALAALDRLRVTFSKQTKQPGFVLQLQLAAPKPPPKEPPKQPPTAAEAHDAFNPYYARSMN